MKLKKFIAIMATVGMVASMAVGCGGSSEEDTSAEGGDAAATEEGGDWDSSMDITIVSREDGSGTRGAFIELFGIEEEVDGEKVDMTTEGAQITNSTSVMMTTVAGDEYAIGYVSLGTLDDSVKALKIDGAEATAENIKSGDYKVSRPLDVVSAEGYIPLDGAEAYAGEAPEGKAVVGGSSSVSPLMEKLIEAYAEVNPNAEIELQTTDSTTGMESAISGAYDIGMASREVKDEEIEGGLEAQVIATDGIAVVVNNNNPTDELSSDQVKSIYTGEALTWDEVVE